MLPRTWLTGVVSAVETGVIVRAVWRPLVVRIETDLVVIRRKSIIIEIYQGKRVNGVELNGYQYFGAIAPLPGFVAVRKKPSLSSR